MSRSSGPVSNEQVVSRMNVNIVVSLLVAVAAVLMSWVFVSQTNDRVDGIDAEREARTIASCEEQNRQVARTRTAEKSQYRLALLSRPIPYLSAQEQARLDALLAAGLTDAEMLALDELVEESAAPEDDVQRFRHQLRIHDDGIDGSYPLRDCSPAGIEAYFDDDPASEPYAEP